MRVEKDWTTQAGLRAVVVVQDHGNRCGYVAVPEGHAMHGKDYDEVDVTVHGGLTFADGTDTYPVVAEGLWWFGYDCAHYGDSRDPELMTPEYQKMYDKGLFSFFGEGTVRSLGYCVSECESLATQLKDMK
jgi:hypothetical protein